MEDLVARTEKVLHLVVESIKVLQALLGHKSAVETWDTWPPEGGRGRPQQDRGRGGAGKP